MVVLHSPERPVDSRIVADLLTFIKSREAGRMMSKERRRGGFMHVLRCMQSIVEVCSATGGFRARIGGTIPELGGIILKGGRVFGWVRRLVLRAHLFVKGRKSHLNDSGIAVCGSELWRRKKRAEKREGGGWSREDVL